MKLSRVFTAVAFFVISFHQLHAQSNIPKGYFQFPIKPGVRNFLAGNMGELRATHFHAGIDIKTDGKEGLPIYAAADGYISRIKISTTGYGNALYLTHPNGFTTVYAHLLSFNKTLADYIIQQQYKNQSFEIEIVPQKDQFVFKKGEVIGLSGNSGSSGGPHLHFEIRDSVENYYDPLLFGFSEIEDHQPPVFEKIAIKTFDLDSRVNGEFGRFEFKTELVGKDYVVNAPINLKGLLGIEILGHDKADMTSNKYGIANLQMTIDGKEIFSHKIDKMHFDDARAILIHTDFEVGQKTGRRFGKLYVEDGNNLKIYKADNRGKFRINDSTTHLVEIKVWDVNQNEKVLKFKVKGQQKPGFTVASKKPETTLPSYSLHENIVKITCPTATGTTSASLAKVSVGYKSYELSPAYKAGNEFVYLWDLRSGLPDSISLCTQTLQFGFSGIAPPKKDFNMYSRLADLRIQETTLFDTLYMDVKKVNETFRVQSPYTPLNDYIFITLKPQDQKVLKNDKTAVYSMSPGGSYSYEGGIWNGQESITFRTKYFSLFVLATDSIPPTIKFATKGADGVKFIINDNLSGIKEFRATINGSWVLMNYDHKRKLLWSSQLNNTPLKGDFQLEVWDNSCNKSVLNAKL